MTFRIKRLNILRLRSLSKLVVIGFFLVSQQVFAQKDTVTVIKAGLLLDVVSGKLLDNQLVFIDHDTIARVGAAASLKIPAAARIIDLSSCTVLPGLIDCHTHLTAQHGDNYYDDIFRKTPIDYAIVAHLYARRTLEAGFTTCRDVGSQAFMDVALRNAINRGDIPGPRILAATLFIGSTGSHGDLNGFSPYLNWVRPGQMSGVANGEDGVREQVRYNVKYGADVIKFGASAGVLSEEESVGGPQFTQKEMNAIVDEAHLWGKKACAHAHGTVAIKMAVRAGVASVEHGSILDDEAIEMMKARGTYLVSDIYDDEYILSDYLKHGTPQKIIDKEKLVGKIQRLSFQRAVKAGVKIAFGTDAGVYPHGWNGKQFKYMVKYGCTPLAAIQAATVNAADLLGISTKAGSLTVGKYADIVALSRNPLLDVSSLEHIQFVMKAGRIYKDEFDRTKQEIQK